MRRLLNVVVVAVVSIGVLMVTASNAQAIHTRLTMADVRSQVIGMHVGPGPNTGYGKATIKDTYWDNGYVWATIDVTYNPPSTTTPMSANTTSGLVRTINVPLGSLAQRRGATQISWWNPFSWDWGNIFGDAWSAIKACYDGVTKSLTVLVTTTIVVKGWTAAFSLLAKTNPDNFATFIVGSCVASVMSN